MKPTVILKSDIDWDAPQWVRHRSGTDHIILTSGEHDRETFEGTMLPCSADLKGSFAHWYKKDYVPIGKPLTIIISN